MKDHLGPAHYRAKYKIATKLQDVFYPHEKLAEGRYDPECKPDHGTTGRSSCSLAQVTFLLAPSTLCAL